MSLKPSINWLFAFIPVTLALEHLGHLPAPVIFFSAALSIIPIAVLTIRSVFEERFLRRELKGYKAYTEKVRYRLIPFVW